jgi:hypothetical protein
MGTNYYVRTPGCDNACPHCSESQLIHLGKTSTGWQLLFQADPAWPREQAFSEWKKLAASGPIEDEYGRPLALDELLAMEAERRGLRSHCVPQLDLGYFRPDNDLFVVDGREFSNRYFS